MVEVLYTHLINESLGDDFLPRLLNLVESIPDSVFYSGGAIVKHTDIAFNAKLQTELKNVFGDTLKIAATIELADLYSNPVEGVIALFHPDTRWFCCLFVPYRESELKLYDENIPRGYIIDEISARIGHYLKSADIDNCFIIGYRDPREPR
ncbi:MAG: hypothetical protein WC455_07275 [Dehalococcoidia bacterium]|jgi:hypothetical protein